MIGEGILGEYQKTLDLSWQQHQEHVRLVAALTRDNFVKPFCDKYGVSFTAYVDRWELGGAHLEAAAKDREAVLYALGMEIPGMPGKTIGFLLHTYKPVVAVSK